MFYGDSPPNGPNEGAVWTNASTGVVQIFQNGRWRGVAVASANPTQGVGYATGAGGAVTQASNKSTGVTLNTPTGVITMNGAALNGTTSVQFTLTNSVIAATDTVVVNLASVNTAGSYFVSVDAVAAGSCVISLRNYSGGALSEAVVLNYAVVKAVSA